MPAALSTTTSIEAALAHASRLLAVNPLLAAEQAQEILNVIPEQPNALMLLALAEDKAGKPESAIARLRQVIQVQPGWAAAYFESGLILRRSGDSAAALHYLKKALSLKPDLPKAWLVLADIQAEMGDHSASDLAYCQHLQYSARDPQLIAAASALVENRIPEAEYGLKNYLMQYPTDVAAIRMLAEVAARLGRDIDAENLLARCIELAPGFHFARQNYGLMLNRLNKAEQALAQPALQRLDLPADRRLGHAQFFGRAGEALQTGGGLEHPDGGEGDAGERVGHKASLWSAPIIRFAGSPRQAWI